MKDIDAVIDKEPTKQRIIDLAELRNRNLLAFKELTNYNDKGKFMNKHPLLTQFSIRATYETLLKNKPAEFLSEYTNVANNVSRYSSFLNNNKRSTEQREKDIKNVAKHKEKEAIMREVLENKK